MNDAGLYQLGLAIIKTTYDDLHRNKRAMVREFKRRHIYKNDRKQYVIKHHRRCVISRGFDICHWNFKAYHKEYNDCVKFFHDPENIWFALYDIEPDYFNKLMEEHEHDNAADRQSDFIVTNS